MVTSLKDSSRQRPTLVLVGVGMLLLLRTTPALSDEIHYMPTKPTYVLSINVSAFLNSKTWQEVKKQFPVPALEREIEKGANDRLGLALANVSRVLLCSTDGEKEQGREPAVIVTTFKPVSAEEIKATKKSTPQQNLVTYKEVKVGTFTVYEEVYQDVPNPMDKQKPAQEGLSFCVPDAKLVLYGKLPELKKILERNKKPDLSASLQAAMKEADLTNPFVLLVDVESMPQWSRDAITKQLERGNPEAREVVQGTKYLAVKFTEAGTLNGSATLAGKDAAGAAGARKIAEGMLKMIKASLNDLKLPPDATEKANSARQILDAIKLTVADHKLIGTIEAEPGRVAHFLTLTSNPAGAKPEPKDDKPPQ